MKIRNNTKKTEIEKIKKIIICRRGRLVDDSSGEQGA
jgi:hypothetical protein